MHTPASPESTLPFALSFVEAATLLLGIGAIVATVAGSIAAVLISLSVERRRRERESQMQAFRALLTLRQFTADPAWTLVFNAVPVDFNGETAITDAWRAVLANVNHEPTPENANRHFADQKRLITAMLFEMAQLLRVQLTEGEINSEEYLARGLAHRDKLYADSLMATCSIAEASQRSATAAEIMVQNLMPAATSKGAGTRSRAKAKTAAP